MKPANIRDVARRAEVSVASVSRVLQMATLAAYEQDVMEAQA